MSLRQYIELAMNEKLKNAGTMAIQHSASNSLPPKNTGRATNTFLTHCPGRRMDIMSLVLIGLDNLDWSFLNGCDFGMFLHLAEQADYVLSIGLFRGPASA